MSYFPLKIAIKIRENFHNMRNEASNGPQTVLLNLNTNDKKKLLLYVTVTFKSGTNDGCIHLLKFKAQSESVMRKEHAKNYDRTLSKYNRLVMTKVHAKSASGTKLSSKHNGMKSLMHFY